MISSGGQAPHARPMGVHRTCGEPGEIELAPIGVELNGPRLCTSFAIRTASATFDRTYLKRSGEQSVGGGQLDFVRLSARVEGPHGAHVW